MAALAEGNPIEEVRKVPRPDPIRLKRLRDRWRAPAAFSAVALALGTGLTSWMSTTLAGQVACVAVALLAVWFMRARDWVHLGWTVQGGAGIIALAVSAGWATAGAFAPLAAGFMLFALATRFAATYSRPSMVPLAGRLPWIFRRVVRKGSLRHGAVGLTVGLAALLLAELPELRVLGVALFPLSLRGLVCELMTPTERRTLWWAVMLCHIGLLAVVVPEYGALGAAWSIVAAETLLFLGSSLAIARHTKTDLLPSSHWACFCGFLMLMAVLSLPLPMTGKAVALLPLAVLVALVLRSEHKLHRKERSSR